MEMNGKRNSFLACHLKQQRLNTDCSAESRWSKREESLTNCPDLNLSSQSYLAWTLLTPVALILFNCHHWDSYSSSWPLPIRPHHHPLSRISSQVPFDWWELNEENSSTSSSVKAMRRSGSSTWDHCRPLTAWLAHMRNKVWLPLQANRRTF